MANYSTTEDIVADALHKAGELSTSASDYKAKALEYVNGLYHSIISGGNEFDIELGEAWTWAKAQYPAVVNLIPPYETGTVDLTSGSTAGTFSIAPAISLAGYRVQVSGRSEFFRITAHTAATTSFTIDATYTEASITGASYKAYKLDYDLATGIQRLIAPMKVYRTQGLESNDEGRIYGMSLTEMQKLYPDHRLEDGVPTYFAERYRSSAGLINIAFNKIVSDTTRVEYEYIPIPTDLTDDGSSIPLIPREHRKILVYGAAYQILVDKNDVRAAEYRALVQASLEALVASNRREQIHTNQSMGRVYPRADQLNKIAKRFVQEVE